ncbi:uncharacterized protein Bfra_003302 [Botrytis fragariae]|uniref:Uncharacterized protein n=1 Tax=Botrytis fragariae TaxID=1964551 RepID=A0A8H6AW35_9HELO|nr:uncharacterized protein Bfra_003302 [Botrytis fragariae]KAF5874853.1 hypothetical protein Bfra_003302 [Botrytis fragariae]
MLHHKHLYAHVQSDVTFGIGTIAVSFVISIDNNKLDSHGFKETPRREAFKHGITSLQHISRMSFTEYVTESGLLQNIQDKIPRATASWAKI